MISISTAKNVRILKVQIVKKKGTISGKVVISGSKSISNRLLIIKGLANSNCTISNLSTSDDTRKLITLQSGIESCERSGISMILDVKNAGTVARFLTAYLVPRDGTWLITGTGRMMQRPMDGIVDCLKQVGGRITYAGSEGFLPIKIVGCDIRGRTVKIDASKSSQFLSAIMMIGPYFENGLNILLEKKPVSLPYVEMTAKLMQKFGAHVKISPDMVEVLPGKYDFHTTTVEPDWSSASYFYELLALAEDGELEIEGLSRNSVQGDSKIAEIFTNFGIETNYTATGILLKKTNKLAVDLSLDFIGNPDIVPSVMATCTALNIKAVFKNIGHLKYKESNRIEALKSELSKIGAKLTVRNESVILNPTGKVNNDLFFKTYDDHRMAMAMAPLSMKYPNVMIDEPDVVNKSFPEFWDEFKKLNFATLDYQN